MFNARQRPGERGRISSTGGLLFGIAVLTGVALLAFLSRSWGRRDNTRNISRGLGETPGGLRDRVVAATPMFTLDVNRTPVAVTKGNESEARAIFESAEFKSKLCSIE